MALFAFSGMAAPAADVNLLINGSFEEPAIGSINQAFDAPNFNIIGWEVALPVGGTMGGVRIYRCPIDLMKVGPENHAQNLLNYCPPAVDGLPNGMHQYLSLSTQEGIATVSQKVATKKAGLYVLSFEVAGAVNPNPAGLSTVHVEARNAYNAEVYSHADVSPFQANHAIIPPLTEGKSAPNALEWTKYQFTFRTKSDSTIISLSDLRHKFDDTSFIDNLILKGPIRAELNRYPPPPILMIAISLFFFLIWVGVVILRRRKA
jgi:hypothetical protein